MSFVVSTGNKQYLVKNGQIVIVDRIEAEAGSVIELPVIHAAGDKAVKTIKATVVSHQKGDKIRVVKYRAKSRYHRQYGFRPAETVLKIEGEFAQEGIVKAAKATKKAETKATSTSKTTATKTVKKAATKTTTKAKAATPKEAK